MTPPNYEIVDCGAFCKVIFFHIAPKNLLGDFFDRLNATEDQNKKKLFRDMII